MSKNPTFTLTLLASLLVSMCTMTASEIDRIQQASRHTQSVQQLCKPYRSRSQLVSKVELDEAKQLMNSVNEIIGIDGLTLLKLITNDKGEEAGQMVVDNLNGPILFTAQFGMGLVILLLSWPFLLICCLCKCCQKSLSRHVNTTLLVFLILSLLLAIGASIYGLVQTLSVGDSIQKAGCSTAIVADDMLYGNTTVSGDQFFNGFYNINSQIGHLQANLGNIADNFSTLMPGSSDPTLDEAFSLCAATKTGTIKISNNDSEGTELQISYRTPLNSSIPTDSIQSFFPQILGSYLTQSGIIWQIYSALDSFNQTLLDLRNSAVNYYNQIGNINKEIESIQSTSSSIIRSINQTETSTSKYISQIKNWIRYSDLSVRVFYGFVISLSAIGITVAILAGKTNMCRYMLNCICVLIFFVSFVGFTVSLSFTTALPPLGWSCAYIENSMSNEANFMENFNFIVNSETLYDVSVCMPYGNGDILSRIGIEAMAGINNLTSVIDKLNKFNISQYRNDISNNISTGFEYIQNFTYSQILDIEDRDSLEILNQLSYSTNGYPGCEQQLKKDSWIPTGQPNMDYPHVYCTATSGRSGNEKTCPEGVFFTGQCSGCMDSTEIFNLYWVSSTHILLDDLSTRYGASCALNAELNNVWLNYYKIKAQVYGPTVSGTPSTQGVLPRATTVRNDVDSLIEAVDPALPNLFSNILANLNSIQDLVDPKYGFIAGLNCKLMGEDFHRVEQAVCGSLYVDFYTTRFAIGLASYGILLAMFFMVWVSKKEIKIIHQDEVFAGQQPYYYRMESINSYE